MFSKRLFSTISSIGWFKITNQTEFYYNHQYQTGLNVLNKSFDKDRAEAGLHFTDAANILCFLNHGFYLREVTLPIWDPEFQISKVKIPNSDVWQANKIVLGRRWNLHDVDTFHFLMKQNANIHANNDYALVWACKQNQLDIVKLLLKSDCNPNTWDWLENPLKIAIKTGNIQLLDILHDHNVYWKLYSSSLLGWYYPITYAAIHEQKDVIVWFLKHDFDIRKGQPLLKMVRRNNLEMTSFLLDQGAPITPEISQFAESSQCQPEIHKLLDQHRYIEFTQTK